MIKFEIRSHCTCLWTLVSCSRLFSRKEIFCFCAALPPVSSESISALCSNKRHGKGEKILSTNLNLHIKIRAEKKIQINFKLSSKLKCTQQSQRHQVPLQHHITFFTLVARSWTNSFRRLWRVWSSLAYSWGGGKKKKNYFWRKKASNSISFGTYFDELTTVSSKPFKSCLACSRLSCITLKENTFILMHQSKTGNALGDKSGKLYGSNEKHLFFSWSPHNYGCNQLMTQQLKFTWSKEGSCKRQRRRTSNTERTQTRK